MGRRVTYAKKFKALRAFNFFALKAWLGYGWSMAGPKVTSAKKFKALRALKFFALKELLGHGWGIRIYEPPHMYHDMNGSHKEPSNRTLVEPERT